MAKRDKRKKLSDIIPKEHVIPLVFAFSFNMAVYAGARVVAGEWRHYDIEGPLDRLIPVWPASVVVYLGCYVFWAANYVLMARQGKKEVCRFFAADFLSRLICFAAFLAFPTTNTRPIIQPEGFWNRVLLFVYQADAADNLFPSIHCLVSWFCYIGLRGRKDIPRWYRGASLGMALAVCISTLTTKQHVLVDVFGGVLLAEGCFWIAKKPFVWESYGKALDFLNKKVFTEGGNKGCRAKRRQ